MPASVCPDAALCRAGSTCLREQVLPLALILAVAYPLIFHHLGARDLWSSHEARAAQDAQMILASGDWTLPRLFDRRVDLQKPPLFYWLVAGIAVLTGGVDALAVRLPAALSSVAAALALWRLGVRRGRPLSGFAAALMLLTALHYTWLARTARIDMPLALAVCLVLVGFFLGTPGIASPHGSRGWRVGGYLALAAGLLLKGPVAAVLPAAVIAAFLLVERRLPPPWAPRRWLHLGRQLGLWWGVPLALGLALPWYVWADRATDGELARVFFWKHNVERGLGGSEVFAAHPWWYYGPRLAVDLLPWTPLLLLLGWLMLRRGWWREDAEARFGLAWGLAIVVVLSCSRFKRADYLLPAYPGFALFLGAAAERWLRCSLHPARLRAAFGLVLVACGAGWCVYVDRVLPEREPMRDCRTFAEEIRRRAPAPQLILFFRTEAHALAFHVGPPIDTLLEWENLDVWAGRPELYHVVMPPECVPEWPRYLKAGVLEEVLRSTDVAGGPQERPLVLLRTRPRASLSSP